MKVIIKPGKNNSSTINIPPSKSMAHRAIIAASLSKVLVILLISITLRIF